MFLDTGSIKISTLVSTPIPTSSPIPPAPQDSKIEWILVGVLGGSFILIVLLILLVGVLLVGNGLRKKKTYKVGGQIDNEHKSKSEYHTSIHYYWL